MLINYVSSRIYTEIKVVPSKSATVNTYKTGGAKHSNRSGR